MARCAALEQMSDELEKIRQEIDRLDDELAALIERRATQAKKIGELKAGAAAYRPERESQILQRVAKRNGVLAGEKMSGVFREIISACRALEEAIRVSYLGPEGTFSEQDVRKHFGAAVDAVLVDSVDEAFLGCAWGDEAFRRCESASAQFTVVPADNSTEGVVGRTLDLLVTTPLRICGEVE